MDTGIAFLEIERGCPVSRDDGGRGIPVDDSVVGGEQFCRSDGGGLFLVRDRRGDESRFGECHRRAAGIEYQAEPAVFGHGSGNVRHLPAQGMELSVLRYVDFIELHLGSAILPLCQQEFRLHPATLGIFRLGFDFEYGAFGNVLRVVDSRHLLPARRQRELDLFIGLRRLLVVVVADKAEFLCLQLAAVLDDFRHLREVHAACIRMEQPGKLHVAELAACGVVVGLRHFAEQSPDIGLHAAQHGGVYAAVRTDGGFDVATAGRLIEAWMRRIHGIHRLRRRILPRIFERESRIRLAERAVGTHGQVSVALQVHGACRRDERAAFLVERVGFPRIREVQRVERSPEHLYIVFHVVGDGVFHAVAERLVHGLRKGIGATLHEVEFCIPLRCGGFVLRKEFIDVVVREGGILAFGCHHAA